MVEDTSELLRAQRQLAWKEVAQRVAHEIKNPLTPIALSAERIGRHLDRGQPDSPSIIRKCSEVILACVGTLRTLVDQFSALAQFPAPQPRPCDMNKIADESLALFAGRLEGITVKRDLEPGLPLVLADHEAIRRALANLIDNAAEAMQGSLLRVLLRAQFPGEDGTAVEVEVSDTGHGLTEEIRERLFLPFYSTKHRGTGLGLSIAAKIIQELGGSIRAESNSPKGARFLIRLPLLDHPEQSTPEQPTALLTHRGALMNHVLVVDDEAEIRTSLQEILTEEGYSVATAATAAEAFVLIEDAPYDVVLLDIWLPDRDGLDVLGDIHAFARRKASGSRHHFRPRHHRSGSQSHQTRRIRLPRKAALPRSHAHRPQECS